jgi:hypothetical protein
MKTRFVAVSTFFLLLVVFGDAALAASYVIDICQFRVMIIEQIASRRDAGWKESQTVTEMRGALEKIGLAVDGDMSGEVSMIYANRHLTSSELGAATLQTCLKKQ